MDGSLTTSTTDSSDSTTSWIGSETLLKRGHKLRIGKPTVDNSNYRRPLLRARHERPRGRAAEKRYELAAATHSITASTSGRDDS
jgi:hypothetical protein